MHIRKIHEGVFHPCDQCDYKAGQNGDLQKHRQSLHDGLRYPCDKYNYMATQMYSLKLHVRT